MRKWLGMVVALCGLTLGAAAHAEWQGRMGKNEAIDKAGMQRMLSQRILKAYCEEGLAEDYGEPREQLVQAINLFDANLLQLDGYVKEPEVRKAIDEVKGVWPQYRDLALKPPTKAGARQLLTLNKRLLPLTHAVVVKMETAFGTSAGPWVNLAGRQRMLSQRMAMFYLLGSWGVADTDDLAAADKAATEYREALTALRSYDRNTPEARALLDKLQSQLFLLQKAVGEKGSNLSFLIATASERMLELADQLTALYASLDKPNGESPQAEGTAAAVAGK